MSAAEKPHGKRAGRPTHLEGSLLSSMRDIKKLRAIAYTLDLKPRATVEENIEAIATKMEKAKSSMRIFFEQFDEDTPENSKILIKQIRGKKKGKFYMIMFLKNIKQKQKSVRYQWQKKENQKVEEEKVWQKKPLKNKEQQLQN